MNRLLFGDNLKWLRDTTIFPDASFDLDYLDPPFNCNADYNVLFREASAWGCQARALFLPKNAMRAKNYEG
jgi:site-specific DNA-methyltransferase (adenine-specific)